MVPPRTKEEVFKVFEPKLVDSLLYAMIEFLIMAHNEEPVVLRLEAGYTFAPFREYMVVSKRGWNTTIHEWLDGGSWIRYLIIFMDKG